MKYKYYLGKKLAYLFSTNDGLHLKIDITIAKDRLQEGINMMKQAYGNDNLVYEQITDELDVSENLLTLEDFQRIVENPHEKNYNSYKHIVSMDLYEFLKNIKKTQVEL